AVGAPAVPTMGAEGPNAQASGPAGCARAWSRRARGLAGRPDAMSSTGRSRAPPAREAVDSGVVSDELRRLVGGAHGRYHRSDFGAASGGGRRVGDDGPKHPRLLPRRRESPARDSGETAGLPPEPRRVRRDG